jgi:hypothetical protein
LTKSAVPSSRWHIGKTNAPTIAMPVETSIIRAARIRESFFAATSAATMKKITATTHGINLVIAMKSLGIMGMSISLFKVPWKARSIHPSFSRTTEGNVAVVVSGRGNIALEYINDPGQF